MSGKQSPPTCLQMGPQKLPCLFSQEMTRRHDNNCGCKLAKWSGEACVVLDLYIDSRVLDTNRGIDSGNSETGLIPSGALSGTTDPDDVMTGN